MYKTKLLIVPSKELIEILPSSSGEKSYLKFPPGIDFVRFNDDGATGGTPYGISNSIIREQFSLVDPDGKSYRTPEGDLDYQA